MKWAQISKYWKQLKGAQIFKYQKKKQKGLKYSNLRNNQKGLKYSNIGNNDRGLEFRILETTNQPPNSSTNPSSYNNGKKKETMAISEFSTSYNQKCTNF